ncbi:TetR/AcrR family transcriptional regulator [Azospirillum halopraeferens]|uniref:TetR/AcrR family transcriptional regulator n=1 Tax=Azospirillum halopraeferens TaxID=34010 RepID=UPI00042235AE|nr:TetR/AcrR family transcriptional regulator [Azospirillum halopraeferens]
MVSKHLLTEQAQKPGAGGQRLDSSERRAAIIDATLPLFAQKGFTATTTKEIAQAAGVSEALIFKHFPSKAALYEAIFRTCLDGDKELERLMALPPSGDTLVQLVQGLVCHFLVDMPTDPAERLRHRLFLRSFLEDGEFARLAYTWVAEEVHPLFTASLLAARESGDMVPTPLPAEDGLWLAEHLCSALATHCLPGRPVAPRSFGPQSVGGVTWFILRGLGMTDAALARLCPETKQYDDTAAGCSPTADSRG